MAVTWLARRPTSRVAIGVVGMTAGVTMFGDVDASHAAGSRSWRWLDMVSQWLHFASAGVWIGGLTARIVVLPLLGTEQRRDLARRFSSVAAIALGLVAVTGTQRGLTEVRSWHGLFDTTFGRWVIVKIGLIAAISTVGLFNRTRAVPAAAPSSRLLRRAGSLEVVLAVVVLVATGFLQSLAPPSSSAAQPKPTPPLVATGNDLGTAIKTWLEISPGTAGSTSSYCELWTSTLANRWPLMRCRSPSPFQPDRTLVTPTLTWPNNRTAPTGPMPPTCQSTAPGTSQPSSSGPAARPRCP